MQGTPQRQALDEALKGERAGSAKIRALAAYVRRKQAEHMIEHEREQRLIEDGTLSYWERQKIVLDLAIEHQYFTVDAYEYSETFDNAETIFAPYLQMPNGNPYQTFL